MVQYEIKDGFVEFKVDAIYEDVKYIFTKEYFEVLGFQDVVVDSGNVPLQLGGASRTTRKAAPYKATGTANFMLGTIGSIVERIKNAFRRDKQYGVDKEVIDNTTLKAKVGEEAKQNPIEYIVSTGSTQPMTNSLQEDVFMDPKDEENAKLRAKIEELQQKLEEKDKPAVLIKDEALEPPDVAVDQPSVAEDVGEYLSKIPETISTIHQTEKKDIGNFDPKLTPILVRFRYVGRFDERSGLSGIMSPEQFEAAMAKQLEDKNNIEVSAATRGRTLQQKHKEEENEADQWYMKNKILDVSKNRDLILEKYAGLKAGKQVGETVSDFTNYMFSSITGKKTDQTEPMMEKPSTETEPLSEKPSETDSTETELPKSKNNRWDAWEPAETIVHNEPMAQDNQPMAQENQPMAQENQPMAQENQPMAELKEPMAKQRGGDSEEPAISNEVFYLYARPEDKVATKLDFRLFPDEKTSSMPQSY
jgi:hypothetical protein